MKLEDRNYKVWLIPVLRTNVSDALVGTRTEGFKGTFCYACESGTENNSQGQMLFDGGWHRPGVRGQPSHTHMHTCSLLFSSLMAWELSEGPKTSHQEGGKRWGGEEGSGPGKLYECVDVEKRRNEWEEDKQEKELELNYKYDIRTHWKTVCLSRGSACCCFHFFFSIFLGGCGWKGVCLLYTTSPLYIWSESSRKTTTPHAPPAACLMDLSSRCHCV